MLKYIPLILLIVFSNAQDNILANYFARPISIILVIFILMGLFLPALKKIYNRRKNAQTN